MLEHFISIFSPFIAVPPTEIELSGILSGTRLEVRENEEVELTCVVRDAKPKATVVWYRQNTEFYTGTYFVSQSAPLHRPRPSVRLSAEPRKQQEAERGNERASITDSAGVPNDLPSLAAQPTRAHSSRGGGIGSSFQRQKIIR